MKVSQRRAAIKAGVIATPVGKNRFDPRSGRSASNFLYASLIAGGAGRPAGTVADVRKRPSPKSSQNRMRRGKLHGVQEPVFGASDDARTSKAEEGARGSL